MTVVLLPFVPFVGALCSLRPLKELEPPEPSVPVLPDIGLCGWNNSSASLSGSAMADGKQKTTNVRSESLQDRSRVKGCSPEDEFPGKVATPIPTPTGLSVVFSHGVVGHASVFGYLLQGTVCGRVGRPHGQFTDTALELGGFLRFDRKGRYRSSSGR